MPTEAELVANPNKQYEVQNSVLWTDGEGNFFVAEKDTGDAGDAFETYDEAVAAIE
jgi:hypothetical protein